MNSNAISNECAELAQTLNSMLGRAQRRAQQEPAVPADGELNKMLHKGLYETARLTHDFMQASRNNYSPQYRARKLAALADGMPKVLNMIHSMEGEKHLSPLFDRMMNREYEEMRGLIFKMRDTVFAHADEIKSSIPEPAPLPAPVVLACTLMLMPVAITWGVMSGIAKGLKEASAERQEPPAPAKPQRHLTLIHNQ